MAGQARAMHHRWTDRHLDLAACGVTATAAGVLAGLQPTLGIRLVLAVIVVICLIGSLLTDGFAGLGVGVVAAFAAVLTVQLGGRWNSDNFGIVLACAGTLILLGWLGGVSGASLRADRRTALRPVPGTVVPATGSLGLLTQNLATRRLEEEVSRAREHGKGLGLLVIRLQPVMRHVDPAIVVAASRAVARQLETLLRETDVPFAISENEVAAILPEADEPEVWRVAGVVLEGLRGATFARRDQGDRQRVTEALDLEVGLASLSADDTAAQLLERAQASAAPRERAGGAA